MSGLQLHTERLYVFVMALGLEDQVNIKLNVQQKYTNAAGNV